MIILHHTCFPIDAPVEYIRQYHVEKRGWSDIGYHWVVTKKNGTWISVPGRAENLIGAHCKGYNSEIGIAVNGNYEIHKLEKKAFDVLCSLIVSIQCRKGIHIIEPHCSLSKTLCPGVNLINVIGKLNTEIKERMPIDYER